MSVVEVRARLAAGMPPGDLGRLPPRVARAVALCTDVGAPVLPALAAAQRAEDDARDRARALGVATAQGRTVANGLTLLPVVLVPGLGRLLGLDLLAFYATTAGRAVGVGALALLAVGMLLVRRLVRRAAAPPAGSPRRGVAVPVAVGVACLLTVGWLPALLASLGALLWRRRGRPPPDAVADEAADLLAAAVAAGIGAPAALRATVRHLPQHGDVLARMALALELDRPVEVPPPFDRILDTLRTTTRWGAPAAPALRELADDLRSDRHHRALEAVERLPALLTFPTALFLLPASVVLVGAPLVASGLALAAAGAR